MHNWIPEGEKEKKIFEDKKAGHFLTLTKIINSQFQETW